MNRKYTSSQYLEMLDCIRSKIDFPSFTTDVIVGFPGEEDVHFENVEVERDSKTNTVCGYSERHIKVLFDCPDTVKNTIVSVQIEEITPSFAMGTLQ